MQELAELRQVFVRTGIFIGITLLISLLLPITGKQIVIASASYFLVLITLWCYNNNYLPIKRGRK